MAVGKGLKGVTLKVLEMKIDQVLKTGCQHG